MRATFYATNKRRNSFTNPENNYLTRTVFDNVYFKEEDISLTNPVLYIASGNLPETSYCVIENYGATDAPKKLYYFVEEIIHDHQNRWYVRLHKDSLLTYKDKILAQTAFIERSESHFNEYVIDKALPIDNKIDYIKASEVNNNVIDSENGCWLFIARAPGWVEENGTMVSHPSIGGALRAWLMDATQVTNLGFDLTSPGFLQSIRNTLGDVDSGLADFKFIPIPMSQLAHSAGATRVYVSNVALSNTTGYDVRSALSFRQNYVLTLGTGRKDFRDTGYFTRFKLFLPGVGLVDLDPEARLGSSDSIINIQAIFDCLSGDIGYRVYTQGSDALEYLLGQFSAHLALDIPISTYVKGNYWRGAMQLATSIGLAAGAAALAPVTGGTSAMVTGMIGGAMSAEAQGMTSMVTASGNMVGSFSGALAWGMGRKIQLYRERVNTTIDPALVASLLGRPCYAIHQLSALSGYTKTLNFHLQNSGYMTYAEVDEVERMFNNEGVFI